MLVFAEEEHPDMAPAERETWLRGCDVEHDNFRAASHWLIAAADAEWALRLGSALFRFWEQRDHLTEGRETLHRMLALPAAAAPTRLRARALYSASLLADLQGDFETAQTLGRESHRIYHELGDTRGVASSSIILAFQAQRRGHYAEAVSLFRDTVALWTKLGDATAVDLANTNMAHAAKLGGDFDLARRLLEQVSASAAARGDLRGVALSLNGLGDVAASQNDADAARRYHHDSLARLREIDDRWGIARVLTDLADVDLQAGKFAQAEQSLHEALRVFRKLGHQRGVARQLEALSWCAMCQSRGEAAITLVSAAAAIRQKTATPARAAERERIEKTLDRARAGITPEAYANAWRQGHAAPLDRILEIETGNRGPVGL
jgi:tetratricopeptide (TPR) repeat protein